LRAAGPIIVAIGHWNFIEAINARALWGRDVTLQVDMPHLRDQAKAYLVDYIQPAVRRGQPVYFILQDAGEYLDITEQISSMANTADVQVALAAGVTAPRWNGANTQRGGVEPLQDLIRNATSVWFGKEKFPDI